MINLNKNKKNIYLTILIIKNFSIQITFVVILNYFQIDKFSDKVLKKKYKGLLSNFNKLILFETDFGKTINWIKKYFILS